MPLAKCPRCQKMFNKQHTLVCPSCKPAEDADTDLVRSAVEDNPNMNAEQVSELTGVDIQVVMRLVEVGAIASLSALEDAKIVCGRCGAPAISASKRLCQACLEKLNAEVAVQQRRIKLDGRKEVQVGTYHANVREALDKKHQR